MPIRLVAGVPVVASGLAPFAPRVFVLQTWVASRVLSPGTGGAYIVPIGCCLPTLSSSTIPQPSPSAGVFSSSY